MFERHVSAGTVVFDIGANVCFHTRAAELVGRSGRVFACEPFPGNLDFRRKHPAFNRVENVKPSPAWACSGTVRLSPGPNRSMGSLADTGEVHVPAFALDQLVADGALRQPDLLKLDIEGGELPARFSICSLFARQRLWIFLATHRPALHTRCWASVQRGRLLAQAKRHGGG